MSNYDFDLFVIGGGSGGVRAARVAADLGAKVGLAEMSRLGGTCVNLGCIPKKLLSYCAELGRDLKHSAGFGWSTGSAELRYRTFADNMDLEILRLNAIYLKMLENAGVAIYRAQATLLSSHSIQVGDRVVRARYILIATGGTPFVPSDIPGHEHGIVSDQAFALRAVPERVAILGSGYIGVEFASIWHGLGAQVDLIFRDDHLLRGFDEEIRTHLTEELRRDGITLHSRRKLESVEKRGDALILQLNDGNLIRATTLLFATGRVPCLQGLGLEQAGVALDKRGYIQVDAYSNTSVSHIYAVGDVTGRLALTPVALSEGSAVARTLFANTPSKPEYQYIPSAVFCHPNVGTIGLTEAQAREKYSKIRVYRSDFRSLKHALTQREKRTLTKLVVDGQTDRVVGLHMVGDHAGEIIQGFAVAMRMGATKADFDSTIGIHPTAAEEFVTMRTLARE